ncbi:MAG: anthranilate phosphoribosyltransferase, partial [Verrucomicrobia bacterium]|nr:anthranilate phosphoribosyltransferase [Verrucomicrobiota bacterium]
MNNLIEQLEQGIDLLPDQMVLAAQQLSDPDIPDSSKAAFLIALKRKGESGEELGGLANAFLQLSIKPRLELDGRPTIDLVGTGGDRLE